MAKKEQFLVTLYLDESDDEELQDLELDSKDKGDIAFLLETTIDQNWSTFLIREGQAHEGASENAKKVWEVGCDVDVVPLGP